MRIRATCFERPAIDATGLLDLLLYHASLAIRCRRSHWMMPRRTAIASAEFDRTHQLHHDAPETDLDRLFRNQQLLGNVTIPVAASHVLQHGALTIGQRLPSATCR